MKASITLGLKSGKLFWFVFRTTK